MSTLIIDSTSGVLPRLKVFFEERGLPTISLTRTAAEARIYLDEKSKSTNDADKLSLIIIDGKLEDGDGFGQIAPEGLVDEDR